MSKFPARSFPFVVVLTLGLVASWSPAGAAPEVFEADLSQPADADALVCFRFAGGETRGRSLLVPPGGSIQEAIAQAQEGDVIWLGAGVYEEDLDFLGKSVTVVGVGPESVLQGTGTGPVVRFASGESRGAVLDSVTVTGGRADRGGGVFISGSSPTIVRTVVTRNQAVFQGSGVFVEAGAEPALYNNVITYNSNDGGDPHGVQVADASPRIVNNTIARNDSNGIFISGASQPTVANNVIALNGSTVNGARRGRGICDFSGDGAPLSYNDFYKNRVSALLRDGRDWNGIEDFQARAGDPQVAGNVDGPPRFPRNPRRSASTSSPADFRLMPHRRAEAIDTGDPSARCNDLDGSRNDMGFSGGPFAPGSRIVPGADACGAPL